MHDKSVWYLNFNFIFAFVAFLWCNAHLARSKFTAENFSAATYNIARSESGELSSDGYRARASPDTWVLRRIMQRAMRRMVREYSERIDKLTLRCKAICARLLGVVDGWLMDDVHLLTARHFRYELRQETTEKFSAVNLERARCASRHKTVWFVGNLNQLPIIVFGPPVTCCARARF